MTRLPKGCLLCPPAPCPHCSCCPGCFPGLSSGLWNSVFFHLDPEGTKAAERRKMSEAGAASEPSWAHCFSPQNGPSSLACELQTLTRLTACQPSCFHTPSPPPPQAFPPQTQLALASQCLLSLVLSEPEPWSCWLPLPQNHTLPGGTGLLKEVGVEWREERFVLQGCTLTFD